MIREWLVRFGRTAVTLVAWGAGILGALAARVGFVWLVHAALVWAWPVIDGVRGSFWYGFGWLPSILFSLVVVAAAVDATLKTGRT